MAYITSNNKILTGNTLFYTVFSIVTVLITLTGGYILGFLLLSFCLTTIIGGETIPMLQKLKVGQIVRLDGPQEHLAKNGTPTMGGIFIIPIFVLLSIFLTSFNPNVCAVAAITFLYFLIGFADDYKIVKEKSNKGISGKTKLLFQIIFASLFMGWLWVNDSIPDIFIFGHLVTWVTINPVIYFCFGVFLLTGMSNATNITDGIDGLCAGTTSIVTTFLAIILMSTYSELSVSMLILCGSCLGFLVYNSNPAKVFMGDTGSLAIGGAITATCLVSGEILPLLALSTVYIIETLSVMIQVGYFKITKKIYGEGRRIFKMAPYHHHLQKSGLNEVSINILAYFVTFVSGYIALFVA
jgi:phospho-N-acetylmuramoyl-pentapeptide-transferase